MRAQVPDLISPAIIPAPAGGDGAKPALWLQLSISITQSFRPTSQWYEQLPGPLLDELEELEALDRLEDPGVPELLLDELDRLEDPGIPGMLLDEPELPEPTEEAENPDELDMPFMMMAPEERGNFKTKRPTVRAVVCRSTSISSDVLWRLK